MSNRQRDISGHDGFKVAPPRAATLLHWDRSHGGTARSRRRQVTPLGNHAGELCARDRAFLFEDPTGLGFSTIPDSWSTKSDARLGDVHVILLSHA
jgi:hypothetical protein